MNFDTFLFHKFTTSHLPNISNEKKLTNRLYWATAIKINSKMLILTLLSFYKVIKNAKIVFPYNVPSRT